MRRAAIVMALALSACMFKPDRPDVEAVIDAPVDTPSGSASAQFVQTIEASPKDNTLQLGVLAVSLVVAVGPLRARRRRK